MLDVVVENGGRVIKNLGDEILFVIEDPVSAAEAALQLIDSFDADDALPPIHAGLAFGPVLYRGGDVYGPVVNLGAGCPAWPGSKPSESTRRWPPSLRVPNSSRCPLGHHAMSAATFRCPATACGEPRKTDRL